MERCAFDWAVGAAAVPVWVPGEVPPKDVDEARATVAEEQAALVLREGIQSLCGADPEAARAVVEHAARVWHYGVAGKRLRPHVAPGLRRAKRRAGVLCAALRRAQAGSVDWRDLVSVARQAEPVGILWEPYLIGPRGGEDLAASVAAADAEVSTFAGIAQQGRRDRWRQCCSDQRAAGGRRLYDWIRRDPPGPPAGETEDVPTAKHLVAPACVRGSWKLGRALAEAF